VFTANSICNFTPTSKYNLCVSFGIGLQLESCRNVTATNPNRSVNRINTNIHYKTVVPHCSPGGSTVSILFQAAKQNYTSLETMGKPQKIWEVWLICILRLLKHTYLTTPKYLKCFMLITECTLHILVDR